MPGLLDLSIELNQMIALELGDDQDLQNYRMCCHFTNDAADGDGASFWRTRFHRTFDPPLSSLKLSNLDYKKRYIRRQQRLRIPVRSRRGRSEGERRRLEALKELIVESFNVLTSNPNLRPSSKNLAHIYSAVTSSGLLEDVLATRVSSRSRKDKIDPILLTVQLVLAHISLNASPLSRVAATLRFPESQRMAYLTAADRPIFNNVGQVDIEWTLHIANFFKFHFLRSDEQLYGHYAQLPDFERPQCWSKRLQSGPQKLGSHWKGSYTFVERHEIEHVRAGRNEDDNAVQDQVSGEDDPEGFQTLNLGFPEQSSLPWPHKFEEILRSCSRFSHSAKTRAQRRVTGPGEAPVGNPISFRFDGGGHDREPFRATGWLNPLPPQHGIPGWQRMTMMKYYIDEDDRHTPLFDSLWAYEGVVLPGGMIILGRWWFPDPNASEEYSGPFILWNVDKSVVEDVGSETAHSAKN